MRENEIEIPFTNTVRDYRSDFRLIGGFSKKELKILIDTKEIHQYVSNDDEHIIIDVYSLPIDMENEDYFKALPERIKRHLILSDDDQAEYVLFTL